MANSTVLAIICLCIGALAGGLGVYYGYYKADEEKTAGCVFVSDYGVSGTIWFYQESSAKNTFMTGTITGLTQGAHGFHIHEFGTVDDNCTMCGDHYNPTDTKHGSPSDAEHHVGDLGNIQADANGTVILQGVGFEISLSDPQSVIGRSLVVHADPDDYVSQPSGNAGGRVACCTILHLNPDYY